MKLKYKDLEAKDAVREIEMMVDSIVYNDKDGAAINIQFWRDVRLYSVDEAIRYLKGYIPNGDFSALDARVLELKSCIG